MVSSFRASRVVAEQSVTVFPEDLNAQLQPLNFGNNCPSPNAWSVTVWYM